MSRVAKIYDQISRDYALKRHRPDEKMKLGAKYLYPGMRILDLGCGPGRFYELMPAACQYIGLDFSRGLLAIARRDYPQASFVYGDMSDEKVWRKLGQFDAIFSFASFHHLLNQLVQIKTLKLCYQHLKDKGLLMIVVWNLLNDKKKRIIKPWKLSDGQKVIKTFYRSYYAFTPEELRNLTLKSGFQVKKIFFLNHQKELALIAQR